MVGRGLGRRRRACRPAASLVSSAPFRSARRECSRSVPPRCRTSASSGLGVEMMTGVAWRCGQRRRSRRPGARTARAPPPSHLGIRAWASEQASEPRQLSRGALEPRHPSGGAALLSGPQGSPSPQAGVGRATCSRGRPRPSALLRPLPHGGLQLRVLCRRGDGATCAKRLARVSGRSIFSLLGWGSSPVRHTEHAHAPRAVPGPQLLHERADLQRELARRYHDQQLVRPTCLRVRLRVRVGLTLAC